MKSNNTSEPIHRISRRDFINRTAIGTAVLATAPLSNLLSAVNPQELKWAKDAKKFTFYMIGHGHIDPVWLWPWTEGLSIAHSTFRSALDRMDETADFIFTSSSALFYEWVAENDPGMFAKIQQRVKEGRWNIVGGWWVEPDMNIPGGESMVRQGLYGQLTFQRLFGQKAKIAFNPDAFGHAGTVPQIVRQQGMDSYVFMRPTRHEKALPSDLFWWEGPDGSRVLTYRIQHSYGADSSVKERLEKVIEEYPGQPMKRFMSFYGVGDHGGGPTKANIRSINELKTDKKGPEVFYSSVDKYFDDIRADKMLNLPVIKEDLQHHAPGCYTSEWEIKKGNSLAETALITAEKLLSIGSIAWAANYPGKELTDAWKEILFLQFHDSLAGTSLYEHSQVAREGYNFALNAAHKHMYMGFQKLEWQIPAEDPESQYVVVFNPHAWEVKGHFEYDLRWWHHTSHVVDDQGTTLSHQWLPASSVSGLTRFLVQVSVPPMGYRQIRMMKADRPPILSSLKVTDNSLENEYYRLHFSSRGSIGIYDKESGREVFINKDTGCRAMVIEDLSDTWGHDVIAYDKEIGEFGKTTFKIVQEGPVKATIRVSSQYENSQLIIDWSLYEDSRHIEANVTLDWHERLKMLKFSFPVDIESPTATYELPYGNTIRKTLGEEDPGQHWIDISGSSNSGTYGLSVINDSKYGYSVDNNDLRISVIRSAVFAHHDPAKLEEDKEYLWMEQGIQSFRMLVIPHKNTWKENNIIRITEEFLAPFVSVYQGIHQGSLPKSNSFLAIDQPNILVSCLKKSEEGNDIIMRCIELHGIPSTATFRINFANLTWKADFRPYEIKSLRINPQSGQIREVNLLEE